MKSFSSSFYLFSKVLPAGKGIKKDIQISAGVGMKEKSARLFKQPQRQLKGFLLMQAVIQGEVLP